MAHNREEKNYKRLHKYAIAGATPLRGNVFWGRTVSPKVAMTLTRETWPYLRGYHCSRAAQIRAVHWVEHGMRGVLDASDGYHYALGAWGKLRGCPERSRARRSLNNEAL